MSTAIVAAGLICFNGMPGGREKGGSSNSVRSAECTAGSDWSSFPADMMSTFSGDVRDKRNRLVSASAIETVGPLGGGVLVHATAVEEMAR
jgi:hypothetical protein